jgi:hypothetical protein
MRDSSRYVGVLWAIVESSFVSWVGLVAFGVTDAIHWINTTPGPSGIANLEGEVRPCLRASSGRLDHINAQAYWNGTFTVLPLFFVSHLVPAPRLGPPTLSETGHLTISHYRACGSQAGNQPRRAEFEESTYQHRYAVHQRWIVAGTSEPPRLARHRSGPLCCVQVGAVIQRS